MFQNRSEAGTLLAEKLREYKNNKEAIVLAIPRGGVIVGRQIANILHLPLSAIVVKKLGAPGNPELAIGAIAPDGVKVVDWELALRVGADQEYLDQEVKRKREELEERIKKLRIANCELQRKKIIILIDDGVATGATILAAIKYIKESQKSRIMLAVPVIAVDTYDRLKPEVDELVALEIPEFFGAVGQFYSEFPQISDSEVISILSNLSQL